MLNNTECNNVLIRVLPVGVEAPKYDVEMPKSRRKNAPKHEEEIELEEVEVEECEELEFIDDYVEEEVVEHEAQISLTCFNGSLTLGGTLRAINEVMQWLARLGVENTKDIKLGDDAFNIYGDCNDGSYRYFRGDFMHKDPARCFGLVEVEPIEDGGRVWRDFTDFDVKATFNLV